MAEIQAQDVPPLLQTLLEMVARQLGMARGPTTLELRFEDGHLRAAFKHEGPIRPAALRRYEEPPAG